MTLIRLVMVLFAGYALMFVVQPILFSDVIIPSFDLDIIPNDLLGEDYPLGATIVYWASSLAAILWYGVAAYFNDLDRRPSLERFRIIWFGLSLPPFIGVLFSLTLFQAEKINEAVPFIALFFVMDALFIFWFATAISTPESLKYGIVPGSFYIRHLRGLK